MKRLIALAITISVLCSCSLRDMEKEGRMVVLSKDSGHWFLVFDKGVCLFEISIPNAEDYTIIDSCDKWDVGDSLDFFKVPKNEGEKK